MSNKLNDARRSLSRAKKAAETRLVELETERRETRASIKSLDAAIRALGSPAAKETKSQGPVSHPITQQ